MKILNRNIILIALSFSFLISCEDFLKEEVYTEYDPETYLQSEQGINSLLVAAYGDLQGYFKGSAKYYLNEFTGDNMWQYGGGAEAIATLYINYVWDPQSSQINKAWNSFYPSIRNANSLLDNIDKVTELSEEKVKQLKAEARFIRAADYYYLWEIYGLVPLITTAAELNLEPFRATEEEFDSFLKTELQAATNDLPLNQSLWGKATKGAALALLGKYHMNTKQWQQAADIYQQIISLENYALFNGDLANMFAVENEENEEVIFVAPAIPTSGSAYMVYAFPPKYPVLSNWSNFGNQFCIYNNWVQTYAPEDKRLGWFLFSYTDVDEVFQDLLDPGSSGRAVRCFKSVPDPDASGSRHGNDVPILRYAEVLLGRAEALNEINGPNQESVDLLNEVRTRAEVPTYDLADFASMDELRDALLDERGWEFVAEGYRRVDLIRHGKLLSKANERGVTNIPDYRITFPIPQNEIDVNPNLANPGY
jgi:starch-binding outer membrane protein, SusD/RagB family